MREESLRKAKLHTNNVVFHHQNQFQHFLKGSPVLRAHVDVMGMRAIHSHITVRGRYQTHVRQKSYNGATSAEMC